MKKNKLSSFKGQTFNPLILPQTIEFPNRLRSSWDYVKNFRTDHSKQRISYSGDSFINVESMQSLKKTSNNINSTIKRISSCNSIGNNYLMNKLDMLGEKLKNAKRQITIEDDQIDTKTIRKQCQPIQKDRSELGSESETERQGQKSLLANYLVVVPKPCNLKNLNENPYSARGNKYFVSEAIRSINQRNSLVMQHINQTMQMLLQYKLFKMSQDSQDRYQQLPIILPIRYDGPHRKTLIFDLDETLIHCFENQECNADIKLTITIDNNSFRIGFNIRPYTISFLKKMKKRWEIIVFTASHQAYADCILDEIDPDRTLFDHRLYRQHCKEITSDLYIKNLSRLNRNLSETVLIDNAAYSYAMHLDNGIPILPYYEGKDFELAALETYLQKLAQCQDVRIMNRQYFQLHQYTSFDSNSEIVNYLYRKKFN